MGIIQGVDAANALVVGASQGIGLGFVKALLQEATAAAVYATYRRSETATELLNLQTQHPRLTAIPMDLTDEGQIAKGLASVSAASPKLHLVINCVGMLHDETQQPEKSLRQIDLDNLDRKSVV